MKENGYMSLNNSESEGNISLGELNNFIFRTYLSFEPLIRFWEKDALQGNLLKASIDRSILEKLKNAPELYSPITDFSVLEKHKDLIELLMSAVYPPAQWEKQIAGSNIPFTFKYFYKTPSFAGLISLDENTKLEELGLTVKLVYSHKILSAYLSILDQLYGMPVNIKDSIIVKIKEKTNPLLRYFQLDIDTSFVKAVCRGSLPELSGEDINSLLKDAYNLENWKRLLPPDNFEFHGFATFTAVDVTEQEAISALKYDLLERDAIISSERFHNLQDKLRSLFGLNDLRLGLIAIPQDWNMMYDYGRKIGESFVLSDSCHLSCSNYNNSVYDKAQRAAKPIIIEDIGKYEEKTEVEKELLKMGIKNILVAPLYYKNQLIGIFELGSPNAGDINSLNWIKVKSVLMLFATAVKRNMEEFETKIQAVIKEEATAIHPSVEWRFRRAAVNLITRREKSKRAEMEPIVFDNVYPLYGLSDIRNSSDYRNESIKSDLLTHLDISKNIINNAYKKKNLPILKELVFGIDKHTRKLKRGLNSGDDLSVIEFIQNELEPVFNHIKGFDPHLRNMVRDYYEMLDPDLHTFYLKRKYYEESVTLINETISKYLDECEAESQKMFPHYFEKYKTDGVEHGMYIGASLSENRNFDLLYLKNLRIWQLMMVCGIVRKTEELKPELKIALETSHLILVQNNPLSIKFRVDEKKFDVDGTYNLRYEIMKKRIDKALIKGTSERLTQPGKIAVIYSQNREAAEYKRYMEYLENIGYIKGKTENYDLEDLQGVHGLRALRFTVNIENVQTEIAENSKEISETINEMQDMMN